MAKKKVHRPKKANAQKPRRRPLGRGSGPVVDDGAWVSDPAAQRYLGPGDPADRLDLARDGYEDEPETAAERAERLALLAQVESIPEERVASALLANPLVAHLGEVLLSGADDDADPVVVRPEGLRPLEDDEVAVLRRWSRAALLLADPDERDELASEWREGGQAQLLAARAALAQHLMAVVEGDDTELQDESLAWLGGSAATGELPTGTPDGVDRAELADALLDVERGEVVIDLVARLALTGTVRLADVVGDSVAAGPVLRDVRLLAAAGLLTVSESGDEADRDVQVHVDPDLRGVLLDVADDLVNALHDPDLDDLDA
ncbi:hypothetical protein [Quadrisphaera setariae]|uniref:Uncharacterized protein n=1 Tax=Quadrisphaera setariae TaxID=2593304 RepID=A0A5C8ZF79_9ACTN|nr:hypothetical protein [Quadrisphaera setariae]TXR55576.1 hypothetical protein FMM08_14925 [Quadrisphaera setariae]